jgi:hypothetical protein
MALIAVAGAPGCRHEEAGWIAASRLGFEAVTELRLSNLIEDQFGPRSLIPPRAQADAAASILARLAVEHHLVVTAEDADLLTSGVPGVWRVQVMASDAVRAGNIMLEHKLEREAARRLLSQLDAERRASRVKRFGRSRWKPEQFDLILNAATIQTDQIAALIERSAVETGLVARGLMSAAAEAQLQFDLRLRLARHGVMAKGHPERPRKPFVHASEEVFANLLDFYRIAWEYEPRTFAIEWDEQKRVTEAFTPDFYLPEFDLYVELTTMKQSLVTKKNRKIRRLRELYPEINLQVFYQKDFENLIFKYGLASEPVGT